MTYLRVKFTHYSLYYYTANEGKKSSDCIAKINCYIKGQKPETFMGNVLSPAFIIKFFKNDSEISPNELRLYDDKKAMEYKLKEKYGQVWKINLNYPISQFNNIISILRHEKEPFYLFIEKEDKDSPKGGLLTEGPIDGNKYEDIPIKY